jgi:hypothetical protein
MTPDKPNAMKFSLLIAIAFFFVAGCKKNDNIAPDNEKGTGKLTLLKGNDQSGLYGEYLPDTLKLKFSSANPNDYFRITCSLIQGNGMIEHLGGHTFGVFTYDTAGTLNLLWRMGCDNNQQKVRFYIYTGGFTFPGNPGPSDDQPDDSITISANAVKPNGWCRSCGYGKVTLYAPKIITADNTNLYLVNNGIFQSTDGGLNWYKVPGVPYPDEIVDAQFNSNRWLYLLTKDHGIHYSKDLQQWTEINNGILDMRDPTGFLVEDTALFVSFYFDGPYRTTNNGGFWRKLLVGGGSQRFHFFKRHPSGKIMLVDDWGDLKASTNNGDNWSLMGGISRYSPIQDFTISPQGLLYIGGDDATIAEFDINAGTVSEHSYYQWNASSQHVNNITFTSNDVYYLVNHTPSPGIYRKNNNWGRVDIGFNDRIDYFYLKNNGNFLVRSNAWLFYKD